MLNARCTPRKGRGAHAPSWGDMAAAPPFLPLDLYANWEKFGPTAPELEDIRHQPNLRKAVHGAAGGGGEYSL